jgi:SAM-dependent methyltransferase
LARWTAVAVLYFSKFIIVPQKCFNRAVLEVLYRLSNIVQIAVSTFDRNEQKNRETMQRIDKRLSTLSEQIDRIRDYTAPTKSSSAPESDSPGRSSRSDFTWQELYLEFENRFRGSYSDIKDRLRVHLPLLEKVEWDRIGNSTVDLGCGRGEWLELMGEEGFKAAGVESNPKMIQLGRKSGLNIIRSDAIQYLKTTATSSLALVTGFHLIEHLHPNLWPLLCQQIYRVLIPGGIILLETPNPENPGMSAFRFHLDPLHQKPVPKEVLCFLLEQAGFERISVSGLHLSQEDEKVANLQQTESAFERFQDYAVHAFKTQSQ